MKRYYFAVTNKCNRECPLCSCYAKPEKKTFLSVEAFESIIAKDDVFEVQFEGGEPLLHPDLMKMTVIARNTGRCLKITLCTNGVLLPYRYNYNPVFEKLDREETIESLIQYFKTFGEPLQVKMSINSHLIEKDELHLLKSELVRDAFNELKKEGDYSLVFNVRRNKKPLSQDDDVGLLEELQKRGLDKISNIFFYQRYGRASEREELDLPFIIKNPVEFYLINPDGSNYGTDLIERAEAMGELE